MNNKVAIYARYSTNNQREASIQDQIRKCRQFAEHNQWEILIDHIYSDSAQSGQSFGKREGFRSLRNVISSGSAPFQLVLAENLARVARNLRGLLMVLDEAKFRNVHFYFVSENLDTRNESTLMIIHILASFAAQQIQTIADNTHRGVEGRFLAGFSAGGRRYGYRTSPKFTGKINRYGDQEVEGYLPKIEPAEAEIVRKIFHLYGQQEYSVKDIADHLNKQLLETGFPLPAKGKLWTTQMILGDRSRQHGILNNQIYIGKRIWNRTKVTRHPNGESIIAKKRMPIEWQRVDAPDLRIVSDFLWDQVKKRQNEFYRKAPTSSKAKKQLSSHLLTSLARCSECGGTFGVVSGGQYAKYGCTSNWNKGQLACSNTVRIKGSILEEIVTAFLSQELTAPALAHEIYSEFIKNLKEYLKGHIAKDISVEEIDEQLTKQTEKVKHIIEAIAVNGTSQTLNIALHEAEREINELKNHLSICRTGNLPNPESFIFEKDIQDYLVKLSNDLLQPSTVKPTLESIAEEILIDCANIEAINVHVIDRTDVIGAHLTEVLNRRTSRIRLQTGTGFTPYTSPGWQFWLTNSTSFIASKNVGKVFCLEGGIHENVRKK